MGCYLVGRTLGEGSFAKVNEAIHIVTGEKVCKSIASLATLLQSIYSTMTQCAASLASLLQNIYSTNDSMCYITGHTVAEYIQYYDSMYCSTGHTVA